MPVFFTPADKTHAVQVGPDATVYDVKALIEARQGTGAAGTSSFLSFYNFAGCACAPLSSVAMR